MPRAKDLTDTLDDDDYEDYEGEAETSGGWEAVPDRSEMSSDERDQMARGFDSVMAKLASLSVPNVPAHAVEEALWNYYFDEDQTVKDISNKYRPKQPKQPKPPSRFDQAASAANGDAKTGAMDPAPSGALLDLFWDIPWAAVPVHRLGVLSATRQPRVGGLKGGSSTNGKPSKLAALAAQRKKAQEEKKKQQERQERPAAASTARDEAQSTEMLDKLTIRDPAAESGRPRSPGSKRPLESAEPRLPRKYQRQPRAESEEQPTQIPSDAGAEAMDVATAEEQAPSPASAAPSAFANAMFGPWGRHAAADVPFSLAYPADPEAADGSSNPFHGPSPDDVVIKAQSQSKGKIGKSSSKAETSKKSDPGNGLSKATSDLKITEAPKVKSKNLNVVEEYEKSTLKDAASFVVIGHVDHGKSTLMGRLLHDLKIVNERAVTKLQKSADEAGKSSFGYAWVMDSTTEERARGVTVDIATNSFTTPARGQRFTILDAPGHRDFIPNMIAGTAQADFAVLVVDSSTNAFESGLKGQTKEHALLARSMGISKLVVAVNKMDSAGWSEERFREIEQQMAAFLTTSGFQPSNLAFIPCVGLTGENVASPVADGKATWYRDKAEASKAGPTLVDALDSFSPAGRKVAEALRLTVMDVFRGNLSAPVSVSGRLDAGNVQVGDVVLCQPAGETATVRGLELDDGRAADWVAAGQIATLHLQDIDPAQLKGGDVLCSPAQDPIRNVGSFAAKVLAFDHILPAFVEVHRGRMHAPGRVSELLAALRKSDGAVDKRKPRIVQPGTLARIRVVLERQIPLEPGARVVLRNQGQTLGAGIVEGVQ